MKFKILTITLITLSFFSKNLYANNINLNNMYNSDSYNILYKDNDKNLFIEKNHQNYKNLRLAQKETIYNSRIEDICEDIYYGNNDFIYNPIEANKCFYSRILQMYPRSAIKLININIKEGNFKNAAFYYGIFKSISAIDNEGAKRLILNNITEEEFEEYYLIGLKFVFNNDLINNNQSFNKNSIVSFSHLKNVKENYSDVMAALENNDLENFSQIMRQNVLNGNQLLLLAQAQNTNRITEFCFQYSDFSLAFNCLSTIIKNNKNHENAINRISYLLTNQFDSDIFTNEEIVTVLGFSGEDILTKRLFLNHLNNEKEKIENLMYFFNKGRMLRLNYNKSGEENE